MRFLLGPELFWLLLYACATALARFNTPPSKAVEDFIQTTWFWIPASSLAIFGLWWIPAADKGALLFVRVWIAGLVGCYLVAEKAIAASAYQNPGAGMGVLGAVCLELFVLLVGTATVGVHLIWSK
jgi:hypothetical protein